MTDTTLQTYTKAIDKKLVQPLRQVLIGRQLVHVTPPKGFGISSVDWSTITEMSDGMVSYAFSGDNSDVIGATPTNLKVPVYWKDYDLDRRMYEGFKMNGVDLDAASALSAAFVAAKAENEAIIMGVTNDGSNYDIDGLYQGAGSDFSDSFDFATPGNPTKVVAGAQAMLDDVNVPSDLPYDLTLATIQRNQLRSLRSANGVREQPEVLEMLNGGIIRGSSSLVAGTGMLTPAASVGEPYVDFYLTKDWGTEHGVSSEHPTTGNINGRVYSAGILRIKKPVALVKISAI